MKARLLSSIYWLIFLIFLTPFHSSHSAVTAGGMAVIGYDDGADSISLVALQSISAGEVIYLTNNGWSNTQGAFNSAAANQASGIEEVLKLTITSDIAIGTIFSTSSNGSGWEWDKSTLIPGQSMGGTATFSNLDLDWAGDQIYLFQAGESNPLLNPTNFIYAMHLSSAGFTGFSDGTDNNSGGIPPSLSIAAGTAVSLARTDMHGDGHGTPSPWGLNLTSGVGGNLQLNTGSRSEWLQAIADSSNWGYQPSGNPSGGFLAVHTPEPSRVLLLLAGILGILMIRKR